MIFTFASKTLNTDAVKSQTMNFIIAHRNACLRDPLQINSIFIMNVSGLYACE